MMVNGQNSGSGVAATHSRRQLAGVVEYACSSRRSTTGEYRVVVGGRIFGKLGTQTTMLYYYAGDVFQQSLADE